MAFDPTMTPGSAVAGQLQDILTRKRNDARQNMLDELNAQNVQSEMDARAENAAAAKEAREASAEYRRQQAQAIKDKETSRARRRTALQGMDVSTLSPQEQMLFKIAVQDDDDQMLNTFLGKVLTPKKENQTGHAYIIDPVTQRMIDPVTRKPVAANSITPLDKIIELSRPPVGTQPTVQVIGTDPTDGMAVFASNRMDSKTGLPVMVKADGSPFSGRLGAKPTSRTGSSLIPPAVANRLATLRGKATDKGGWFGGKATPQDIAAFDQLFNNTIVNLPVSEAVKSTARKMIETQNAGDTTVDDIVQGAIGQGLISEEEAPHLADIMRASGFPEALGK